MKEVKMQGNHEKAKVYATSLKSEYEDLLKLVQTSVPPHSVTDLQEVWRESVQETGYSSNKTAVVIALATLEPIIQSLSETEDDNVLAVLQVWFSALLKDL